MKLSFQYPHTSLQNFVNRYLNFETKNSREINILPNGYTYLTYSYLNPATFSLTNLKTPTLFVSGIVTSPTLSFRLNGETGHFGIEFKPGALHYLSGLPLYPLHNNLTNFMEWFPQEQEYVVAMKNTQSFKERCSVTDHFLIKMGKEIVQDHLVEQALSEIQCSGNRFSVSKFAGKMNISERHLRRKFKDIVGVSPKIFARIHQVKCMVKAIKEGRNNLNEVYYDCRFFDTPHSIRAFQELLGMNPGKFIENYNDFLGFYLAEAELPEG